MPNEFTVGPINLQIKSMEPGVSKDQSVTAKVCDVESLCDFFIPLGYEEVEVMGDASGLVIGPVNVLESNWFWQLLTSKFQPYYCFLVDEIFDGATVNEHLLFCRTTEQM